MILSYKKKTFSLPLTSVCILCTKGLLNNGDIVEVISPLFPSMDYDMKTTHLTKTLSVPLRTQNPIEGTGNLQAKLHCTDENIFDMYVDYPR